MGVVHVCIKVGVVHVLGSYCDARQTMEAGLLTLWPRTRSEPGHPDASGPWDELPCHRASGLRQDDPGH